MIHRGVGYSCTYYGTGYGNGFPDESRATAELTPEGLILIFVGVSDVGQGGKSVMWQLATETLEIPKERILIHNADSNTFKDSGTAAASRQTYNTGNAVVDACQKMKKLLDESPYKDLSEKYHDLISQEIEPKTEGYFKATSSQVDLETGQGAPYWPYAFATQKATVEVDDETGKVDVKEIIAVHDAGRIVNPMLAEGQIQGGIAMGIGYALMESVELRNGSIKNRNFSDYIIPTSQDIPIVQIEFVEDLEDTGPFGAKGLGEPAMLPTAPAILNAIYDAISVRIYDMPATCDKVLLAIQEKKQKGSH